MVSIKAASRIGHQIVRLDTCASDAVTNNNVGFYLNKKVRGRK